MPIILSYITEVWIELFACVFSGRFSQSEKERLEQTAQASLCDDQGAAGAHPLVATQAGKMGPRALLPPGRCRLFRAHRHRQPQRQVGLSRRRGHGRLRDRQSLPTRTHPHQQGMFTVIMGTKAAQSLNRLPRLLLFKLSFPLTNFFSFTLKINRLLLIKFDSIHP